LTAEARWAPGEGADRYVGALRGGTLGGQTVPISTAQRVAVLPGASVSFRITDGNTSPDAAPAVELFLQHLPAAGAAAAAATPALPGGFELAVSVQDYAIAASDAAEPTMNAPVAPRDVKKKTRGKKSEPPPVTQPVTPDKPPPTPSLTRELIILPPVDMGKAGGGEIMALIVMPSRFGGSAAKGLAAIIRAAPAADDPATQELLAAAVADVRKTADAARGPRPGAAKAPAEWPGFQSALAMLDRADVRRRAMVYLGAQTGSRLCEDIALVADEPTLQQLATDIRARAAAASPPFSSDALGWMLDQTCIEWAARLSGENRMPPELSGVLSTYAGEAGRRPAILEELLRSGANSRAALEARLISENVIYLDDSSPAARVRALDWLADRGRAPAGYDPLAPPRQRRDALERAIEDAARAATQPSATQPVTRPRPPDPAATAAAPGDSP
jgi:hypothetical protein